MVHAIVATAAAPLVGQLHLVALPTPESNPHAVGRITSVEPTEHMSGTLPVWTIVIEIVDSDDAAARAMIPRAVAIDAYATTGECERWFEVDTQHYRLHGYGRNHW
jgi:hypothetical protein